jgi:GalNAc-alpha-(1->4)-GalNAc-alpha-(1->3)-diNAcBac-PP-undecaprenol alpha-1,4-N-acetyl-D-galactosaminyltransferase
MSPAMRIALVISGLGPGGAERVISLLANGLAERGHDVFLVTLAPSGSDFYSLDPRVKRRGLAGIGDSGGTFGAVLANSRRIRGLRGALRAIAPETVLAFVTQTNVLALIACTGLKIRVVVSERIDPANHSEGILWSALRAATYQAADLLVVQTEQIASWFKRRLLRSRRVVVIPNPVVIAPHATCAAESGAQPYVLAAGRLVPQKGFDVLIRAFALAGVPGAGLAIAGEGPELRQLQGLAAELGLENRVRFLGNQPDLPGLMGSAQLFVLPSRYEGLPNVLLEALASGVATIATDTAGARTILRDGEFGLLVPRDDAAALGSAISLLLNDHEQRRRFAAAGRAAVAPFEYGRVLAAWEAVLRPGS